MSEAITNCHQAEKLVHDEMHGLDHEEAWVIFLTTANTVIAKEMLSKGTLNSTLLSNQTLF